MKENETKLPRASWWPEPITEEDFRAFVPEDVELTDGFLCSGEDAAGRRVALLAVLLRNCGLEAAVRLADPVLWREALERWELYGGYTFSAPLYDPSGDD